MSNIKTDYALFEVFDYKGENVLSSYNLSITPFTFHARIPNITQDNILNQRKVVFDFGDGTTANTLTATHVYELPGSYNVKMIIRDCTNNAVLASYSTDVIVHDYIKNAFNVTAVKTTVDSLLTEDEVNVLSEDGENVDIVTTTSIINLSAGERYGPFTITSYSPFYQEFQTIMYGVSGSGFPLYHDLDPYKYNHLNKYCSFYTKKLIPKLNAYEYNEVSSFTLSSEPIYVQLSGTEIVRANETTGILAGLSGQQDYYFVVDGVPTNNTLNIKFYKDRNNLYQRDLNGYSTLNHSNNLNITLSCNVGEDTSSSYLDKLSITSTGLDKEGLDGISVFNISPTQFKNAPIPFIIKPKTIQGYTCKNINLVGTPTITITTDDNLLTEDNNVIIVESGENIDLTSGLLPGSAGFVVIDQADTINVHKDFWYAGVLYISHLPSIPSEYTLTITANYTNGSVTFPLVGSCVFTAYPQNYYNIPKHNENIDFTQTIKDLRFQEILLDKNIFFDDFIRSIFGDIDSSSDTLGKTVYERIFNFVSNTKDLDTCNVDYLISIASMLNEQINIYDTNSLKLPPNIKNIISKISTHYNKFKGIENQFNKNFDSKGHLSKNIYGKNLGEQIDTETYFVQKGTDIVAFEKFSGTYDRLNSYQPFVQPVSGSALDVIYETDSLLDQVTIPFSATGTTRGTANPKQKLFTGTFSGALSQPRNPDCIFNALSGITSWVAPGFSSYTGVAITKRHVLFAHHWPPAGTRPYPGEKFAFYDLDGNKTTATVVSGTSIRYNDSINTNSDLRVVLIDSDLPDTITPIKLLNEEAADILAGLVPHNSSAYNIPLISSNTESEVNVRDFTVNVHPGSPTALTWIGRLPSNPIRQSWYIPFESGDNASPACLVVDNELVLLGNVFGISAGSGSIICRELTAIQNSIDILNAAFGITGDYTIQTKGFTYESKARLTNYSVDWGWPLVLPQTFTAADLDKFYIFYEFTPAAEGTIMDGIIDFGNHLTTFDYNTPLSGFRGDDLIEDIIVKDTLFSSLSLFT